MNRILLSLLFGFAVMTAGAQVPDTSATAVDAIRSAMARYEYSYAISIIDSALVRLDTADVEQIRTLTLTKARCQKKLYRFRDAGRTLEPIAFMDDVEVMGELADSYANDGKIGDALSAYYLLMSKQPSNVFFRLQVLSLLNKAKDWKACIEDGKSLLQLDSLPQAMAIVGYAYSNMNQADSAYVYYDMASRFKPENVGYLTSICNLLLAKENYGEVIARTGGYLVNITPNEPEIESVYGFASYQLRNYEEAFKAFNKLKADGDKSFATYYYAGLSAMALKEYNRAAKDFAVAWQIDSTNAALAANYGTALGHSYKHDQAIEMFDKAAKLMMPDPVTELKIVSGKGYSLSSTERFAEAIPYYKRAYELDPTYISSLYVQAYCYERLKDFATAKEYYEKYLKAAKPGTATYKSAQEGLDYVTGELFMEEQ